MRSNKFRLLLIGLLLAVPGVGNLAVQATEPPTVQPAVQGGQQAAQVLAAVGVVAKVVAPDVIALDVIAFSDLPVQGQQTYRLILQGGPFPYNKDATVFGNRERLLPLRPRGYYREYTVQTPAFKGRGAKRIVCGGPATAPDACFYTSDHYASFRKIVP